MLIIDSQINEPYLKNNLARATAIEEILNFKNNDYHKDFIDYFTYVNTSERYLDEILQLYTDIEKMKKGKDGEKGKKPKPKPGQGKDLAKMMGRQEMIRKQLEKMAEKIEESENGNAEGLRDAIENMEKTEEDIANNSITQETLNRQNQIIEQLLKAENAEQERDKEEKREAKEADQIPHQIQNLNIAYYYDKRTFSRSSDILDDGLLYYPSVCFDGYYNLSNWYGNK